jgi:hypothetical protein
MRLSLLRALAAATLALTPPLAGCKSADRAPAASQEIAVTALDPHHDPLHARFDQDVGAPRLLVMASPT